MKAHFLRKASTIEELKESARKVGGNLYIIEAVIELLPEDYEVFSHNLLDEFDFIAQHVSKMFVDAGQVWHCILVKTNDSSVGILVESEGYHYARYAAYYSEEENCA